jgi:hypothetical protein
MTGVSGRCELRLSIYSLEFVCYSSPVIRSHERQTICCMTVHVQHNSTVPAVLTITLFTSDHSVNKEPSYCAACPGGPLWLQPTCRPYCVSPGAGLCADGAVSLQDMCSEFSHVFPDTWLYTALADPFWPARVPWDVLLHVHYPVQSSPNTTSHACDHYTGPCSLMFLCCHC